MFKRLKLVCIFVCYWSISAFAQDVKGIVKDVNSRLPIANAQIITSKATILTNNEGRFTLRDIGLGSIIAVRIMGYETIELTINKLSDTLRIYLRQSAIALKEIEIKTKRNFKQDSLALRKEYANAFFYKGPSVSDMFIEKDINYDSPFGFSNPRSTASLVSLNVLQIFSLFGKKHAQTSRLSKTLVRDEELNYIDHVFSKDKVRLYTGLDGEPLIKFMNLYRPSILALKKMTGYELTIYIKKSFEEFIKIKT